MRARALTPRPEATLLECLKVLVRDVLPDLSASALAGILAVRCRKSGGLTAADIPPEVAQEVFGDAPDAKDVQDGGAKQ
eukprot:4386625-Lingulodinium_polyedra.AAC.1